MREGMKVNKKQPINPQTIKLVFLFLFRWFPYNLYKIFYFLKKNSFIYYIISTEKKKEPEEPQLKSKKKK